MLNLLFSNARFSRIVLFVGVAALFGSLAVPAYAVTLDMVTVGNPGNANDTINTGTNPNYGAVADSYQIGKYDVTIGQYAVFLNAADPNGTNPNGIYNAFMETDLNVAGISYTSGASSGSKYSVMAASGVAPFGGVTAANRPITYVSWFDAARFANWMTNGQGAGSTETGAYTLNNATSGNAVAVNAGAAFYIPTENEWYKAAYFSPNYGGVGVPGYYAYATQSDSDPGNIIGSGTNQANWRTGGGYSVTLDGYNGSQNFLTDVGAFSGSQSFYGTFDQSGNVFQWNDLDGTAGSSRGRRGGDWDNNNELSLSSSFSYPDNPSFEDYYLGFRLAAPVAVPEPSTCASLLAGLACAGYSMFRRRKRA